MVKSRKISKIIWGRTVELTGFHEAQRSENPVKRFVGRLLRIEAALDSTTFLRHYSASIGTAVPLTTIPPVAGISTISRLGRPIASP
jgi:hypothetical protein